MSLPWRSEISAVFSGLVLSVVFVLVPAQAQPIHGTALVRHAPILNGKVEGSIRQMTAESATLNGNASVTGDLFVPGMPRVRLNGSPSYGGTQDGSGNATPTNHTITMNGGASLGHVVRRTDAIALPNVVAPPPPSGTRSVTLNNASQSPGDFATLKNLTLNGGAGQVVVPPGTYGNFTANGNSGFELGLAGATVPAVYNFQNLTLNSSSSFTVAGPVVVTVAGGFSTNSSMGTATHPEWLGLRIAGGGLTLNGNVSVHAHLEAPAGMLTLNGSARFVGAVKVDRLTINGNSLLQLTAPAGGNQPPTVALIDPVDGAHFTAPATFRVAAAASDTDGSVTKVEFYHGTVKLAESSVVPYEFVWNNVAAGSYALAVVATDNVGSTTTSAVHNVIVGTTGLPFLSNFEPAEGYQPGSLNGQIGWSVLGSANIVASPVYAGEQAVAVAPTTPPTLLIRAFVNDDPSVTFVDLFARPAAGSTSWDGEFFDTDAGRVSLVDAGATGEIQAFAGNGAGGGTWVGMEAHAPLDATGLAVDWYRLTTRADYTSKKWDLYLNGRMIAANLGFVSDVTPAFAGLGLSGHSTLTTGFDDLLIGFENPLFDDDDHDGMDDAWETAHGLDAALDDREGDLDVDGLTNIIEYVLGTNPDSIDSDADGMHDGWEYHYGLKPTLDDAAGDLDADGVGNLIEYLQGRDPTKGAVPDATGVVNLRVYLPGR